MFNEIKRFMQKEDPNGDWMECEPNDTDMDYMYDTIAEWLEDGLQSTPRVQSYLKWLEAELTA